MRIAARWLSNSLFIQLLLNKLSRTYSRVRYEDLVVDPDRIAHEISATTSRSVRSDLPKDSRVSLLNEYHLVGSNPGVRQSLGSELRLRLDDEWWTRLPRSQQWLVTAICGGLMAAYNYPVGRRGTYDPCNAQN
jgi:hypothetical protein